MTGSRSSNDDKPGQVANTDGEDSDDEESEILEESPCGRWVKRREVVSAILFLPFYFNSPAGIHDLNTTKLLLLTNQGRQSGLQWFSLMSGAVS